MLIDDGGGQYAIHVVQIGECIDATTLRGVFDRKDQTVTLDGVNVYAGDVEQTRADRRPAAGPGEDQHAADIVFVHVRGPAFIAAGLTPMASTGQVPMHAPQPVQALSSIAGRARPPTTGVKRIARGSQASPQLRQVTPWTARQASLIRALCRHGGTPARTRKAPGSQRRTHSPHQVHPSRSKDASGYPCRSLTSIDSGQ